MGEYYGKKIKAGEINLKTGAAWTIDDVRPFWQPKVVEWLQENS